MHSYEHERRAGRLLPFALLRVTAKDDYQNGNGHTWTVHNVNLMGHSSVESFNDHMADLLNGREPQYLELFTDCYPQSLFEGFGVCWEMFDILNGELPQGDLMTLEAYFQLFGNANGKQLNDILIESQHAFIGKYDSADQLNDFITGTDADDLRRYIDSDAQWLLDDPADTLEPVEQQQRADLIATIKNNLASVNGRYFYHEGPGIYNEFQKDLEQLQS